MKYVHCGCLRPRPVVCLLMLLLFAQRSVSGKQDRAGLEDRIRSIIEDLSVSLGISPRVAVRVLTGNTRLASVERDTTHLEIFQFSFEEDFLETLDESELRAAIAHELGHVWIFTHFPYLQTEDLANQQALRVASRHDLDRVYEKVRRWKQGSAKTPTTLLQEPANR
jgi:hypothetical protein